jgi:uncharacterized membrane protein
MFQFLFKYPAVTFSKGSLVLLGPLPTWMLIAAILIAAVIPAWLLWRSRERLFRSLTRWRVGVLWFLQAATLALLLLLLWQPAISVTALRTQQNIIAVVVDDSRSMSEADVGATREQQALDVLRTKLLPDLQRQYQVRLYRLDSSIARISDTKDLRANGAATRLGAGLRQLADEAATLPIGSVVLLTDGADNSGGIDLATLNELRRRRLPVNTIGFGREQISHDVEMSRFDVPAKALVNARVEATVVIRQNAFEGRRVNLAVTADGRPVATRQIALADQPEQTEAIEFNAGKAGVRRLEARIDPLPGESNVENNRQASVLSVDGAKRRILYVEGEPRWEYKFLRRAVEDDPVIQVVSMLRTTQNKIYRQGISNPNELIDGFPTKPEDLFAYQGLILGSVESGFFTSSQQQMIKDFVDKRGGGLLFLGGRASLADGNYNAQPFSELLPVILPNRKNTFQRKLAAAELTPQGEKSLLCRIEDDPTDSLNHWNVLPYLADYQNPGTPKPGAVVLVRANVDGSRVPLLVTENYGRGRTGVFATGGSWRWRMQQPVGDTSQETFWRQLSRWVGGDSPSPVVATLEDTRLRDTGNAKLHAEVRDKQYSLVSDAEVQANIIGPQGDSHTITFRATPSSAGMYEADADAAQAGSYVAEIVGRHGTEVLGRDVLTFQRENGVAENFHKEQNRELLERLAQNTGGRYYTARDAGRAPGEISFSEAGLTAREEKDLWDMPIVFLMLLALRSAEWLLRRRWGLV